MAESWLRCGVLYPRGKSLTPSHTIFWKHSWDQLTEPQINRAGIRQCIFFWAYSQTWVQPSCCLWYGFRALAIRTQSWIQFWSCACLSFGWGDRWKLIRHLHPTHVPSVVQCSFQEESFHSAAALGEQALLTVFQVENLLLHFSAENRVLLALTVGNLPLNFFYSYLIKCCGVFQHWGFRCMYSWAKMTVSLTRFFFQLAQEN